MFAAISTTDALTGNSKPHQAQLMHPQAPRVVLCISLKFKTSRLLPSIIPTSN